MISKKNWVIVSIILAMIFHFIFYFDIYGRPLRSSIVHWNEVLGLFSALIFTFLYIGTKWRVDLKGSFIIKIFDLMILWIFISYFRGILNHKGIDELKDLLFDPYIGLSLFPALFFIVGININYFSTINKMLLIYCVLVWVFSLFFINYSELQVFLLMPIFYIIVTYPMQSSRNRILTLIISVTIVVTSLANRAGVLRILISYLIVVIYYIVLKIKISKKLINILMFCILISPFYFLYLGINRKNVFEVVLGTNNAEGGFGPENLKADTRTFLYTDVFQDMNMNKAFIFGKGINAGYATDSFETFNRTVVEVGFLQILLKSGIVGFLLYMALIVSAIFKALNRSESQFMKYLGVLLLSYVLMLFIENIIGFNLFNIVVWFVVGMCHSQELRGLNDEEIKDLFLNDEYNKVLNT